MTTLYRKYRPKTFSDLSGQRYIVETLQGSIRNGRIGHAYVFTGPRGTGKTTVARIFAKTLNCSARTGFEPCNECPSCVSSDSGTSIDIIEIDAASHTGVDNIRQLREEVRLVPAAAPYKIYIIDEAHMLSTGAFNALLKTLEEPPAHAIFILATTEIHKIPETIASRCQQFDFARLSHADIVEKLARIAQAENTAIDMNALDTIAIAAEGGMRDAESLLAQVMSHDAGKITAADIERLCGLSDRRIILKFIGSLLEGDTVGCLELLAETCDRGLNMEHFSKSLLHALRQMLFANVAPEKADEFSSFLSQDDATSFKEYASRAALPWILSAIDEFLSASGKTKLSFLPQLPLEIAAVRVCVSSSKGRENSRQSDDSKPSGSGHTDTAPKSVKGAVSTPRKDSIEKPAANPSAQTAQEQAKTPPAFTMDDISRAWPRFLNEIGQNNPSIAVFLANCRPMKIHDNGSIVVSTPYAFYKDKLADAKNRLTMEGVLGTILGGKVHFEFEHHANKGAGDSGSTSKDNGKDALGKTSRSDGLVSDVLDVFGATITR